MSTSAVVPNVGTAAVMPIKNEFVTFAVVVETDAEGKVTKSRITSSENAIKALKADDYKGDETIAFEQSVICPRVGTLDGFLSLITDPEEQINIINRGIGSKFSQKINTTLKEVDDKGVLVFTPVEPNFDATPLIQEVSTRSTMSPVDKALKTLANSGLSAESLQAILAQFASINAQKAPVSETISE